jgi:hypothetical protein
MKHYVTEEDVWLTIARAYQHELDTATFDKDGYTYRLNYGLKGLCYSLDTCGEDLMVVDEIKAETRINLELCFQAHKTGSYNVYLSPFWTTKAGMELRRDLAYKFAKESTL